jgi:hypothetical protein
MLRGSVLYPGMPYILGIMMVATITNPSMS